MELRYNEAIYKLGFNGELPWDEIYAFSREEEGFLPSKRGQDEKGYTFKPELKKAVEIQLEKVQSRIDQLTTKILNEQGEHKKSFLNAMSSISNGTFRGHLYLSDECNLDTPEGLERAIESASDPKCLDQVRQAEVFSVELGDGIRYAGLVKVARGLHQYLQDETYDPAVMGDISKIYASLLMK